MQALCEHACSRTRIHAHATNTCVHMCSYAHRRVCTCTQTFTCVHMCSYAHRRVCTYTCVHMCSYAYRRVCTCTQTRAHSQTLSCRSCFRSTRLVVEPAHAMACPHDAGFDALKAVISKRCGNRIKELLADDVDDDRIFSIYLSVQA